MLDPTPFMAPFALSLAGLAFLLSADYYIKKKRLQEGKNWRAKETLIYVMLIVNMLIVLYIGLIIFLFSIIVFNIIGLVVIIVSIIGVLKFYSYIGSKTTNYKKVVNKKKGWKPLAGKVGPILILGGLIIMPLFVMSGLYITDVYTRISSVFSSLIILAIVEGLVQGYRRKKIGPVLCLIAGIAFVAGIYIPIGTEIHDYGDHTHTQILYLSGDFSSMPFLVIPYLILIGSLIGFFSKEEFLKSFAEKKKYTNAYFSGKQIEFFCVRHNGTSRGQYVKCSKCEATYCLNCLEKTKFCVSCGQAMDSTSNLNEIVGWKPAAGRYGPILIVIGLVIMTSFAILLSYAVPAIVSLFLISIIFTIIEGLNKGYKGKRIGSILCLIAGIAFVIGCFIPIGTVEYEDGYTKYIYLSGFFLSIPLAVAPFLILIGSILGFYSKEEFMKYYADKKKATKATTGVETSKKNKVWKVLAGKIGPILIVIGLLPMALFVILLDLSSTITTISSVYVSTIFFTIIVGLFQGYKRRRIGSILCLIAGIALVFGLFIPLGQKTYEDGFIEIVYLSRYFRYFPYLAIPFLILIGSLLGFYSKEEFMKFSSGKKKVVMVSTSAESSADSSKKEGDEKTSENEQEVSTPTTEDIVQVEKEEDICLRHKGKIEGINFACPKCGAIYCVECVKQIKNCIACGILFENKN